MPSRRLDLHKKIEVFGGVAFKYIAPDLSGEALAEACTEAKERVNVATTSGERTGSPPSIQKLVAIRSALKGEIPLAVASGVTEENAISLFPYVDKFLVSSSITKTAHTRGTPADYFIPERVRTLADIIHKETE
jgi:predicted TIM-barrel enzyme